MKKYCPTCGTPNPAAANFCCSCGSGMKLSSASQKPKKKNPLSRSLEIEDEDSFEEEEEEAFIISASQLDVDVAFSEPTPKYTIGQIMEENRATGGPANPTSSSMSGGGLQKQTKEEFLREFKREAGSLKQGDQQLGDV